MSKSHDSSNQSIEQPDEVANPRIVVTGVTDNFASQNPKGVSVSLDWLWYSVAWPSFAIFDMPRIGVSKLADVAFRHAVMPCDALTLTGDSVSNLHGYTVSRKMSQGVLRFNPDRPEMKIHVDWRGDDLRGLRLAGVKDIALLNHVHQVKGSISRLDVAIDYYGESSPLDMLKAWREKRIETSVRKVTSVSDEDSEGVIGGTVYFGSPSSERRLKIYNKAAQMGCDFPWTRIELVLRNDYANMLGAVIRDVGLAVAGRQAIRDFVSTDAVDWYRDALIGDAVDITPVGRKDTDTDKWLLSVVAPLLERRLAETVANGDNRLLDAFQGVVQRGVFPLGKVSLKPRPRLLS